MLPLDPSFVPPSVPPVPINSFQLKSHLHSNSGSVLRKDSVREMSHETPTWQKVAQGRAEEHRQGFSMET